MATTLSASHKFSENALLKTLLLSCGVVSSLYYFIVNIIVVMKYDGYNVAAQTVSELSAIGAPTRSLWVLLLMFYTLFVIAFGLGVWQAGNQNRNLRIAGSMMIAYAIIGVFWPPMHTREALAAGEGSLTDTLHIAFTAVTVPMMLLIIGFSAAAFGKGFRIYSIATIAIQITFGILTSLDAPKMQADLPTPLMGVWERISVGAYMVWVMVFAVMLLRKKEGSKYQNIKPVF